MLLLFKIKAFGRLFQSLIAQGRKLNLYIYWFLHTGCLDVCHTCDATAFGVAKDHQLRGRFANEFSPWLKRQVVAAVLRDLRSFHPRVCMWHRVVLHHALLYCIVHVLRCI